jgi:kynurenine formamidase
MKIIDLTHLIQEDMPVFPGTEKPILNPACTLEKDGFREKLLTMYSHTGTHMDAPSHMLQASNLDDFDIGKFIGPIAIIDADQYEISLESVKKHALAIEAADFVLLRTAWDKKWHTCEYFSAFPAISEAAAIYLSQFNLKGYGVDAISVDHMENQDFSVHHILLQKDMVLIENLKNLDQLESGDILSVLPLKIKEADGSPIRAVAIKKTLLV